MNSEKKIVGIGYNGMPNGCSDDKLPWKRVAKDRLDTKYPYGEKTNISEWNFDQFCSFYLHPKIHLGHMTKVCICPTQPLGSQMNKNFVINLSFFDFESQESN